jgi:hypothetical protein
MPDATSVLLPGKKSARLLNFSGRGGAALVAAFVDELHAVDGSATDGAFFSMLPDLLGE